MALASVCETCGYHPRDEDCNVVDIGTDADGEPQIPNVLHVICYQCGSEWVE
jgi:hypothetical protein